MILYLEKENPQSLKNFMFNQPLGKVSMVIHMVFIFSKILQSSDELLWEEKWKSDFSLRIAATMIFYRL